mmetsp:Transcript_68599/g.179860  ORF Transcript_68599/g.179860 Transcript_68599/m.179860 type:complete len:258 (+) Transcript_68599:2429-3202(+)
MHREGDARRRGEQVDEDHGPEVYGLHVLNLLDHDLDVRVADVEAGLVDRGGLRDRRPRAQGQADDPQQGEDEEGEQHGPVLELEVEHHPDARDVGVLDVGVQGILLACGIIPPLGEFSELPGMLQDLRVRHGPHHRSDDVGQHGDSGRREDEVECAPVPPPLPQAPPLAQHVALLACGASPAGIPALLARGHFTKLAVQRLQVGVVHDRIIGLTIIRNHAAHVTDPADLHAHEGTGSWTSDRIWVLLELHSAHDVDC